jgi:hypothetical protein
MTIQFKKFLIGLFSIPLAVVYVHFLIKAYLAYTGPGNTFGGEIVLFGPPAFVALLIRFYFLLKKHFLRQSISANEEILPTVEPMTGRVWASLIFWFSILLFYVLAGELYRRWEGLLFVVLIFIPLAQPLSVLARQPVFKPVIFWLGLVLLLKLLIFWGAMWWIHHAL